MTEPARSRVRLADVPRLALVGLRARRLRATLSAAGVAIGVAAMIAVLGISSSSRADLTRRLNALGTNLLTVTAGRTLQGDMALLPPTAEAMVRRAPWSEAAAATGDVEGAVYRNRLIPSEKSGGISIEATSPELLSTVRGTVATGRFLDAALAQHPAVVLGAAAARQLGTDLVGTDVQVVVASQLFTVVGILRPVALAPDLDRAAIIGWPVAKSLFGAASSPSVVYARVDPHRLLTAQTELARTANPFRPEETSVNRPSDAIAAQAAAQTTFSSLLLGLGAVALLVGGVGIANVMVVAVLERRAEIGLRRALGARRVHVGVQFLGEALMLSALGGIGGVALGCAVTAGYAATQAWPTAFPVAALAGGVVLAALVGAVAGLYPATRAARMTPTVALRGA